MRIQSSEHLPRMGPSWASRLGFHKAGRCLIQMPARGRTPSSLMPACVLSTAEGLQKKTNLLGQSPAPLPRQAYPSSPASLPSACRRAAINQSSFPSPRGLARL